MHQAVCVCVCMRARMLSRVQLFATSWTVAHQAPLNMGFSRQEILEWVCHFLLQGKPGIEPEFPALAGEFFTTAPPGE